MTPRAQVVADPAALVAWAERSANGAEYRLFTLLDWSTGQALQHAMSSWHGQSGRYRRVSSSASAECRTARGAACGAAGPASWRAGVVDRAAHKPVNLTTILTTRGTTASD